MSIASAAGAALIISAGTLEAKGFTATAEPVGRVVDAEEVYAGRSDDAAAAEATAAKAPWYRDDAAGFKFRVPIDGGEVKTAAQVAALILERPGTALPDGAAVSGGVFARNGQTAASGIPFLVVWTQPVAAPESRSDLAELMDAPPLALKERYGFDGMTFERDKLRGYGTQRLAGGLKARALVQMARGEDIVAALYYTNDSDGDLLDRVAASLVVAPEHRLTWGQLPRGGVFWLRLAASLSVLAAGLAVGWLQLRRKAWRAPQAGGVAEKQQTASPAPQS